MMNYMYNFEEIKKALEPYKGSIDGGIYSCIGSDSPDQFNTIYNKDGVLIMHNTNYNYLDVVGLSEEHFKEVYEIPGGHHISEEAARKIMTEIVPMAIKKFRKPGDAADIVRNGLNEEELFKYAHRLSIYNKPSIMKSKICGCFYCGKIYPATSIRSFIDNGPIW